MKKLLFLAIYCAMINSNVFAQSKTFIGIGIMPSFLTEAKVGKAYVPTLHLGIEKSKIRLNLETQFANYENLTPLNTLQGVTDFYQMSNLQANLNISYSIFSKNRFRLALGLGLIYANRKLNTIDEYTFTGNEVLSAKAKEIKYNQVGGQFLLDMEAKIVEKVSIFVSPRYNIVPQNVKSTSNNYKSDDFSVCLGIRYFMK